MAGDQGLAGLVVGVTGAGQGIGRGLAQAFAARGARLVVSDVNGDAAEATAAGLRAGGASAVALRVDIRSADEAAAQVALAVRQFGRLDLMLCNAGIMQLKPFLDLDAGDWDRMLGVNVTGSFLTLQAAARQMLAQAPLAPGRSPA